MTGTAKRAGQEIRVKMGSGGHETEAIHRYYLYITYIGIIIKDITRIAITKMKLTKEQIMQIPKLKKLGYDDNKIADMFNCHRQSIVDWKRKLRASGHVIENNVTPGRKPLLAIKATKLSK